MLRLVLVGGTTRRRASICLWRLSSGFGGDGALAPPGRDSGGIVLTIVLGIVGAVVGNWLGRVLGFYRPGEVAAEDKNFFTHSGVEYRVLPRVVHKTATSSLAGWWSGAGFSVSANELPAAASSPALLDQGPVRKPHDCE